MVSWQSPLGLLVVVLVLIVVVVVVGIYAGIMLRILEF